MNEGKLDKKLILKSSLVTKDNIATIKTRD